MQIKKNMPQSSCQSPEIEWKDGKPYSRQFNDVYFSADNGLEETEYVFLSRNQLQHRWQALKGNHFTIAETGFGTGLNFLSAWRLWNKCAPPDARMHFVSIEKYPLSLADLTKALSLWPQLAIQRDKLLAQYHFLAHGFHRLVFDDGRIVLTLLIGDINDMLPQLQADVDAWFLDGFAPAGNPEMWGQAVFDGMSRLSHAKTTFATFTSAGAVRRGLETAGFEVSKAVGFGRKREMLCGRYHGTGRGEITTADRHAVVKSARVIGNKLPNAIVIGGGIAGCASAHALASRGWQVSLVERHAALAQEASGNPIGVLYPRLAGKGNAQSRLALGGFLYTLRLLQQLGLNQDEYNACGLLQLAFDARELERCKDIAEQGLPAELVRYIDKKDTGGIAGVSLAHDGLYFPSAGWVSPPAFCNALARHANVKMLASSCALKLTRNGSLWQVLSNDGLLAEASIVIIAGANDSANFEQSAHVALEPVRGQITFADATASSSPLKTVVCADGYISPSINGKHCLGATFSPNDVGIEMRQEDHHKNLTMLRRMLPELYRSLKTQPISGRVALRSATSDYLPVVGQLLDSESLTAKPPRHNAAPASLPWLEGLYMNAGHGSKGLITAPLGAEILAGIICGEAVPGEVKLLAALDPNRFLLRKLGLKRLMTNAALR